MSNGNQDTDAISSLFDTIIIDGRKIGDIKVGEIEGILQKIEWRNAGIKNQIVRLFVNDGLNEKVAAAIVEFGVTSPARLCSMSESEIKNIRGVGRVGFAEIMRYVKKFRGGS